MFVHEIQVGIRIVGFRKMTNAHRGIGLAAGQLSGKENKMHQLIRKSVVFLLAAALVIVPLTGSVLAGDTYDEEAFYKKDIRGEAMLADLVLVRPLGILATIAGGILWVLRSLFHFPKITVRTPERKLA